MLVGGCHYRSIWLDERTESVRIIDQTKLPHAFEIRALGSALEVAEAIRAMRVRGAPLIGAAAAHGFALAVAEDPSDLGIARAIHVLENCRPTAINLRWALDRVRRVVEPLPQNARAARAREEAVAICDEDVTACSAIGDHGLAVVEALGRRGPSPVRILTHCNAGWLATVDWGTALAPVYKAHDAGIPIHVWVDETRPRNQGALLTAFELREHGVPHTVIVDNAGGHLMQRGQIDLVLVGSDRTTASGDVCNKIGTYLKAIAAHANDVPFYVALPVSTIDWSIRDGLAQIPIEERGGEEIRVATGRAEDGRIARVELFSEETAVANPAFDVTPARYVTGLITEHGIFEASSASLRSLMTRLRDGQRREDRLPTDD